MQYEWCPLKVKRSGHRQAQREDHVKTKGEDGQQQAKERGLRMKSILLTPFSQTFSASRTVRKQIFVL